MGYVSHIIFPYTFVKSLIFQIICPMNHYWMLSDHIVQSEENNVHSISHNVIFYPHYKCSAGYNVRSAHHNIVSENHNISSGRYFLPFAVHYTPWALYKAILASIGLSFYLYYEP